jgi:hypothetical protein
MRNSRESLDQVAWAVIQERSAPRGVAPGLRHGGRPSTFAEILRQMRDGRSWEHAFAEFLDEFYRFKDPAFFANAPPKSFPKRRRAFLAATAEHLSRRFGLMPPAWTEEPEYFLRHEWSVGFGAASPETRKKAAREFLRRGIVFNSRGLIRL